MTLPKISQLKHEDTFRLLPERYSQAPRAAADRLGLSAAEQSDMLGLNTAVFGAKQTMLSGIGQDELVANIPYDNIINGAFTFAHPQGSRFNGPERGAWYAGFEQQTALAEVIWHKNVHYQSLDYWTDSQTYDLYLADFSGQYHDIRSDQAFAPCLDPQSYVSSQSLAAHLLRAGALGLIYPSVRYGGGTCIVCFRPALVQNVRKYARYRLTWQGGAEPDIIREEIYST